MPKIARRSRGAPYECRYDWPEDCFAQCGGDGIVITRDSVEDVIRDPEKTVEVVIGVLSGVDSTEKLPYYRTAFFEAFPRSPNTFIRGEGKTIEEAEEKCWLEYRKYFECDHPSFEPRKYRNGSGFCTKCGLWFSDVIPPIGNCEVCGTPTWFSQDITGGWWCEDHYDQTPQEKKSPERLWLDDWKKRMDAENKLFNEGLRGGEAQDINP